VQQCRNIHIYYVCYRVIDSQALKDVTRETFLLNNDTVDGHEVTGTIRRAIKDTYRLSGSKDKNPLFPGMKLLNTGRVKCTYI
jgi:hypothetical protein